MDAEQKAETKMSTVDRQAGNQSWWTSQTMSYDWKDKVEHPRFTPEWYDAIDRRLIHGSRLFIDPARPFAELMRTDQLAGKRVLEIGCGMGFHSEILSRSGANLTSIDLSPTSVGATTKRFALKDLKGDVRQMDAEKMEFEDGTFDFVWSWGVIHHSSHTARILREIRRVLKPEGEAGIMVYALEGMPAYITMMTRYAFGFWGKKASLDNDLWKDSDGFSARYYSSDQWRDLVSLFFDVEEYRLCGQDADVVPLPRQVRGLGLKLLSNEKQRELAARRGSLLFTRLKAI